MSKPKNYIITFFKGKYTNTTINLNDVYPTWVDLPEHTDLIALIINSKSDEFTTTWYKHSLYGAFPKDRKDQAEFYISWIKNQLKWQSMHIENLFKINSPIALTLSNLKHTQFYDTVDSFKRNNWHEVVDYFKQNPHI